MIRWLSVLHLIHAVLSTKYYFTIVLRVSVYQPADEKCGMNHTNKDFIYRGRLFSIFYNANLP